MRLGVGEGVRSMSVCSTCGTLAIRFWNEHATGGCGNACQPTGMPDLLDKYARALPWLDKMAQRKLRTYGFLREGIFNRGQECSFVRCTCGPNIAP